MAQNFFADIVRRQGCLSLEQPVFLKEITPRLKRKKALNIVINNKMIAFLSS
jgi:hypothetical protein